MAASKMAIAPDSDLLILDSPIFYFCSLARHPIAWLPVAHPLRGSPRDLGSAGAICSLASSHLSRQARLGFLPLFGVRATARPRQRELAVPCEDQELGSMGDPQTASIL